MAYSKSKGLISIATAKSGSTNTYTNIDKYMQPSGVEIIPDQMQDLDSYVNANGNLKRNVLSVHRTKINCNTRFLTYNEKKALVNVINAGTSLDGCSASERKVIVRYYDDYSDSYKKMNAYIPDITFKIGGIYDGKPTYLSTTITFIAYGKSYDE